MRRIIAASVGLVLALAGAFLVINYARNADERAASGLKTQPVVVAIEALGAGTPVSEFGDRVEIKQVPGSVAVTDAVSSLDDVQTLVLTADVVPGEQLTRSRFATAEDLRARGDVELPEELADHHQVTVLLEKARALGGDIAPGDTVGVFMSFDIRPDEEDQEPAAPAEGDGTPIRSEASQVSVTDLALHKVPVVRVEGAFVAPTVQAADEDQADGEARDRIFVTFAVEPDDAARLIFAAEWGSIWLSLEPEGAPEDRVPTVIISLPARGQTVLQ